VRLTKPVLVRHDGVASVNPETGRVESGASAKTVLGGVSRRSSSAVLDDGGQVSASEWTVYLPANTAVAAGDRVEVDGDTFLVVEDPYQAWNQRKAAVSHLELRVRKGAR